MGCSCREMQTRRAAGGASWESTVGVQWGEWSSGWLRRSFVCSLLLLCRPALLTEWSARLLRAERLHADAHAPLALLSSSAPVVRLPPHCSACAARRFVAEPEPASPVAAAMSASATRTVEGVQIDVEQLFAVQVDFSHLVRKDTRGPMDKATVQILPPLPLARRFADCCLCSFPFHYSASLSPPSSMHSTNPTRARQRSRRNSEPSATRQTRWPKPSRRCRETSRRARRSRPQLRPHCANKWQSRARCKTTSELRQTELQHWSGTSLLCTIRFHRRSSRGRTIPIGSLRSKPPLRVSLRSRPVTRSCERFWPVAMH